MKKLTSILAIIIGLFTMQSCNIDSEITYYQDQTTTTTMAMNFEEMMDVMSEMKEADSTKSKDNKGLGKLDSLPSTWTNTYDLSVKEGKNIPTHPDSIRLAKKMFIKKQVKGNKTVGMAFKFERFTKKDFKALRSKKSKKKENAFARQSSNIGDWDGKKLVINTEELNFDDLKDAQSTPKETKEDSDEEETPKKMQELLDMIKMEYTQTLKFENKIKSIKGKHDWVKQIDKHTIQIKFSSEMMKNETPLKHKDKKIIVITKS